MNTFLVLTLSLYSLTLLPIVLATKRLSSVFNNNFFFKIENKPYASFYLNKCVRSIPLHCSTCKARALYRVEYVIEYNRVERN